MMLSLSALKLFAQLLEDAEQTASICDDVEPWCSAKPDIEALWELYASELEKVK